MPEPIRATRPPSHLPLEKPAFDTLADLALQLRWSWNHAADRLWAQLDPTLWELTRNPWLVLQTVSRDRVEQLLADARFRSQLEQLTQNEARLAQAPTWFETSHPQAPLTKVAYFSMEYMLSEAVPIYSGGLGNVAGDQLKAANDLGVPVVGVGLLYQRGYFRQVIDRDGAQQALYPFNEPGQLPISPLRYPNGAWLRLEVVLPGGSVWLRAWQIEVGRVKLYLLDSNDAANPAVHRGLTGELYGGGPEVRLKQELLLGIGGWRLLEAMGIRPDVCHLNEGHAAFVVLERARSFMAQTGQPFDVALAVTRAGNLFTTHTAVAAGFDRFPPALIRQYLRRYAEQQLHITIEDLLALGRQRRDSQGAVDDHDGESFNMAYLAVHGSGAINGVSRLHGQVSRRLFAPLFPRRPHHEVPIGHVTNGVHSPTWDSEAADSLWTEACGKARWAGPTECLGDDIRRVSDQALWDLRCAGRQVLVDHARAWLPQQLALAGAPAAAIAAARGVLDSNTLTLGFARRFATYKRPNLLLHDQQRLLALLHHAQRPVQLLLAGKAHPSDQQGQALIQEWIRFVRRPEVSARVVFLADHDMRVSERLVQGVDVWLNTPRRPWEASGTSGMKVLVNGGLNLSTLDGWWAEAFEPDVGWAIGDGHEPDLEHEDTSRSDDADADALYRALEQEVVPLFYERDQHGLPTAWLKKMRESMARLTPQFSANRAVRDYVTQYYLPAATRYGALAANQGARGAAALETQQHLRQHWGQLHFGEVQVEISPDGASHVVQVPLFLGQVDPHTVTVELFADAKGPEGPTRLPMSRRPWPDHPGGYLYSTPAPATRPVSDYTPRVTPALSPESTPLASDLILWQH